MAHLRDLRAPAVTLESCFGIVSMSRKLCLNNPEFASHPSEVYYSNT
jgi:hypothetical protein